MRYLAHMFVLATVLTTIAACSATDARQIPVVGGVPITGTAAR